MPAAQQNYQPADAQGHQQRQGMAADPLAGRSRGQRTEQAANAPQLRNMGIGAHQLAVPIPFADQNQRQGEQATGAGPEQYRSEERRVGKEWRARQEQYQKKTKKRRD